MKVELSLHASKLKNVAGAMKGTSDPFAVATHIATTPGEKPTVLGKTEVIKNSLSPNWTQVFVFDYELGTPTKIAVQIYDEVRKGDNKSMGSALFDIGEVLGARGSVKAKKLKNGGTIFAHVRKSTGMGVLRLQMKGEALKNTEGFLRKSDPFFELSRRIDSAGGQTWDNVFRSDVVKDNLNPNWQEAVIPLSVLCGGDLDTPVLLTVYDHESKGKHVLMGELQTSVNGLLNMSSAALKVRGKETGTIVVQKATVSGATGASDEVSAKVAKMSVSSAPATAFVPSVSSTTSTKKASFIDYVAGGCELNVCVAIDFTGSNGDPRQPGTLHHFHSDGSKNDYEKAISSIVSVLEKYDTDKKLPVFGFGAKYGGVVRHCFQCGPTAEVHGVDGVLNAYHQVFQSGLIMSGPTVFTEVIQMAAARAISAQESAKQQGKQAYTVLLILTDGSVSDVGATAAALDEVSHAPLSIVIVGVGTADFSGMQFLDDASKPGKRDIAQFVEFNKHSRNSVDLTSATLREIPDQLVSYFQGEGIDPLPPVSRSDDEVVLEAEEDEIDLSLNFEDEEIVVSGGGVMFRDGF